MKSMPCPIDESLIEYGSWHSGGVLRHHRPTDGADSAAHRCLLCQCQNDGGVLECVRENGWIVPDSISLTGLDDAAG